MKPGEFQQQRRVRDSTDTDEPPLQRVKFGRVENVYPGAPIPAVMDKTKGKLTPTLLGNAVREKRNGRSIRKLAQELGEAHTNIQYVELGRMPRPQLFLKLMVWLRILRPSIAKRLMKYAAEKEKP